MPCAVCHHQVGHGIECVHCRTPTVVDDQYRLEQVVEELGHTITYRATRVSDDLRVTLRRIVLPFGATDEAVEAARGNGQRTARLRETLSVALGSFRTDEPDSVSVWLAYVAPEPLRTGELASATTVDWAALTSTISERVVSRVNRLSALERGKLVIAGLLMSIVLILSTVAAIVGQHSLPLGSAHDCYDRNLLADPELRFPIQSGPPDRPQRWTADHATRVHQLIDAADTFASHQAGHTRLIACAEFDGAETADARVSVGVRGFTGPRDRRSDRHRGPSDFGPFRRSLITGDAAPQVCVDVLLDAPARYIHLELTAREGNEVEQPKPIGRFVRRACLALVGL